MGAVFQIVVIDKPDIKAMRADYAEHCQWLRDQYGSDTYAGHLGTIGGLEITRRKFSTQLEADAWLCNHCEKWDAAKAVKFETATGWKFIIGAWCPE